MIDIEKELLLLESHLNKKYGVIIERDKYLHNDCIKFKSGNYIFSMFIDEPSGTSYAPDNYLIYFDGDSKKDKHGFGWAEVFTSGKYDYFDETLEKHGLKPKKESQISLFDL